MCVTRSDRQFLNLNPFYYEDIRNVSKITYPCNDCITKVFEERIVRLCETRYRHRYIFSLIYTKMIIAKFRREVTRIILCMQRHCTFVERRRHRKERKKDLDE